MDQKAPLQQRLEKLETLLDMNRELARELDLDKLLALIAEAAVQVMDADRCSVYVVDSVKDELWTRVAQGIDEIRMPSNRGIVGLVVSSGEILNVADAYDRPEFDATWDQKHGYTTRSMLCCPLRGRLGQVIGAFAVLNKQSGLFDEEDEVLLQAMAAGVAVALENALLVDELRTTNHKLSEAYDQLLLTEKLSILGLLASTVAHDIQNPLAVIMGNAEVLGVKFPQTSEVTNATQIIVRQTERITELVDSIQNYARGDSDTFDEVDMHRVLGEALMLTERLLVKFNIRVNQQTQTNLSSVLGNANRLEQVFMNLIQNAAQAMQYQRDGALHLVAREIEKMGKSWVEVEVRDTGGGIAEDKVADIFKAFYTTKANEKGTGLGLAICQRIVTAHEGEIELQNRHGYGATFLVRIPVVSQDL
ncbi:MAG: GAF domain-containing protein [Candidatus Latescibacteria bacterium]|jgi:signal transduction histidine kinase|nr:GAF domain-containing protein [Candidatus Latescibacterota bacterium]MBT4139707.1 GAF domain-containing protein [Candidatus Latescibacterota bacterium]MBT5829556.1 GAF domain-containing protein [Candidatus Latescibacterota bacterium]